MDFFLCPFEFPASSVRNCPEREKKKSPLAELEFIAYLCRCCVFAGQRQKNIIVCDNLSIVLHCFLIVINERNTSLKNVEL
jgi:hypothetical protein